VIVAGQSAGVKRDGKPLLLACVALFASLAPGCVSRHSYVGENNPDPPPLLVKVKQDPRFAKETLEAQKRLWWP